MDILRFTCAGMRDGGTFPAVHTGRGEDRSPPFSIQNLSPAAKTLAITLEDVSHPLFKNFTHWLIWNIPAVPEIPGSIPAGRLVPGLGRQGLGYGLFRYAGPKPPQGKRHMYRLTVYALDSEIDLPFPPVKRRFIRLAEAHILQQGSITCSFTS
ncbi:MAG: YbhB/YbcL family Raf kinase inhibitor-like protein [Oscillospiraceae bacterium]|jgi:Raf kinase inhibitor-like YbhB/YbcL family protein|nr:YbhB/YbcL family Raf kinase inhibitor-like protein [Oscillospiraceae bacterium]